MISMYLNNIVEYFSWLRARLRGMDCDKISIL